MIVVKLISHSVNHLYSSNNISKTVKKSEMYFLSVLISYLNIEYVEPSKIFPKYTECESGPENQNSGFIPSLLSYNIYNNYHN